MKIQIPTYKKIEENKLVNKTLKEIIAFRSSQTVRDNLYKLQNNNTTTLIIVEKISRGEKVDKEIEQEQRTN